MKVQQTLAQTWKRRRDSDHAEAKRLMEERGVGLLRVPDELLDIILGFSDLSTRFAAVQTSHQFSGSVARLSPKLEYRALRARFPLLATIMDSDPAHAPTPPGELFRTYSRFFDEGPIQPRPEPTVALDSYTLAVEAEVIGAPPTRTKRSVFVGTGSVDTSENNKAVYEFAVPHGVYESVDRSLGSEDAQDVRIKIVAARRVGARLQHAELYTGTIQDGDANYLFFGYEGIPNAGTTALRWYEAASEFEPGFSVDWVRSMTGANAPSTVIARFSWCHPSDIVDMSLADACLTLEHYVDWK